MKVQINRLGIKFLKLKQNWFCKTKISKKGIRVIRGLNNINININEGDKIGILGPNGIWKTTLLKLLSGIYATNFWKVETVGKVCSMI